MEDGLRSDCRGSERGPRVRGVTEAVSGAVQGQIYVPDAETLAFLLQFFRDCLQRSQGEREKQ